MPEFAEKYINPFDHPDQLNSYEDSLKYYRDLKNSLDTAFSEGFDEGFEEGKETGKNEGVVLVAMNMLKNNLPIETIINLTGLSKEEITNLKKS
ncbi:MAG: hypothetical protein ACPGJS_09715 [Flammeovirgaceae bacterium]